MRQKKVKMLRRAAGRDGGITSKDWRQTKKFFSPGVKIPKHILKQDPIYMERKGHAVKRQVGVVDQTGEQEPGEVRTPREQEAREPSRIIIP